MQVSVFYLRSIGSRAEIEKGMAALRGDLYQPKLPRRSMNIVRRCSPWPWALRPISVSWTGPCLPSPRHDPACGRRSAGSQTEESTCAPPRHERCTRGSRRRTHRAEWLARAEPVDAVVTSLQEGVIMIASCHTKSRAGLGAVATVAVEEFWARYETPYSENGDPALSE